MSLRLQIFCAILLACVVMAAGFTYFASSSMRDGFETYLQRKDLAQAQQLSDLLERRYRQWGDWQPLRAAGAWQQLLSEGHGPSMAPARDEPPGAGPPPGDPKEHGPGSVDDWGEVFGLPHSDAEASPPPSPGEGHEPPPKPRFLLDAGRRLVAGQHWFDEQAHLLPLHADGEVVGYLGLPLRPDLRDFLDRDYLQQQRQGLIYIMVAGLLLGALVAWLLSKLLVGRIQQLATQVSRYSRGDYRDRLPERGGDELAMLAVHLNNLGASLERTEQTQRQWVADTSHELRTPLALLQAELEALEDGVRPLDQDAPGRLLAHVDRLKRLVNDLYELALADIGTLTYRKEPADLREIVAAMASAMGPRFAEAGLTLEFDADSGPVLTVLADRHRLEQLLLNLLQNALHYTEAPGRVLIELEATDETLCLTVEDSPPGVPEAQQALLFERLYRVESSRSRHSGGAGLGLSLCRSIVDAHQGSIDAATSMLGGLKVSVMLPRYLNR